MLSTYGLGQDDQRLGIDWSENWEVIKAMRREIPTWLAAVVIVLVVVAVAAVYFFTGRVIPRRGAPTPPEAMKKLYLQKQSGQQPGFHMPGYAPPEEIKGRIMEGQKR